MLIMGVVGYILRKFDFDPAPLVLGLVIAPTFELSLRQSLRHVGRRLDDLLQPPDCGDAVCHLAACCWRCRLCRCLTRKDWRGKLAEVGEKR